MGGIREFVREIIRESDTITKLLFIASMGTVFFLGIWIGILINIWMVSKHWWH